MASLVAYDDSDSEAETEPVGSFNPAGQMKDASDAVRPPGRDFASEVLDAKDGGALPTKHGSCEDAASCHLPLARLWRSDSGSCPNQRLQWPRTEPEVTFPTSQPARPSLWTSHAPAGHVPLAAARLKQVKLSWGTSGSPEPSFCARTGSETPGKNGSSLQRQWCEDCVVPYTPKRLRQLQALSTETGKSKDMEPQGPCAGRAPAPLCVAPQVSEFIQPYLDSQYKETKIPRKVLFHLRGHRGPVNNIQWCPVSSKSHMLLSTSMDKTFKVWNAVDSGSCLQTYSLHSEAVRAARWSPCGRHILSGGFDSALRLTDLETGTQLFSGQSDFRITTLKFHPRDHNVFVCGGFSSEMKAWDVRTSKAFLGQCVSRVRVGIQVPPLERGSGAHGCHGPAHRQPLPMGSWGCVPAAQEETRLGAQATSRDVSWAGLTPLPAPAALPPLIPCSSPGLW
ncbi:WD repeat-containing protein 25 isoform X2 [Monodon monoceros]|uniref:WD repeat-containing protein 25 isoform X2 n=1 Tax=Monodon monoceros TaxID=40151 RepID=UPI0010F83A7B|nr:WD repeat-containing protein 25 isoform X2 [Monodon monoceros]